MKCHWRQDPEIGAYLVPGCWGGVLGGYCSCKASPVTLEDRIASLEAEVRLLKKRSDDVQHQAEGGQG